MGNIWKSTKFSIKSSEIPKLKYQDEQIKKSQQKYDFTLLEKRDAGRKDAHRDPNFIHRRAATGLKVCTMGWRNIPSEWAFIRKIFFNDIFLTIHATKCWKLKNWICCEKYEWSFRNYFNSLWSISVTNIIPTHLCGQHDWHTQILAG